MNSASGAMHRAAVNRAVALIAMVFRPMMGTLADARMQLRTGATGKVDKSELSL
jgi:hypothetical protein